LLLVIYHFLLHLQTNCSLIFFFAVFYFQTFFFTDLSSTALYSLSLHDALPILRLWLIFRSRLTWWMCSVAPKIRRISPGKQLLSAPSTSGYSWAFGQMRLPRWLKISA